MHKKILLVFFLLFSFSWIAPALAQGEDPNFRDSFIEANLLMEEKFYEKALEIWLDLLSTDPDNSNINYKVGVCHLNSKHNKTKSLPYLKKAVLEVTQNYDIFNPNERNAPFEANFFLGKAYHLNYELDNAIQQFKKIKELVGEKHYLYEKIDHEIAICNNAKNQLANPKKFQIKNIGPIINSEFPDYSPVISVDESALFFTSRRVRPDSTNLSVIDPVSGKYYEDIYVSYKERTTAKWQAPELLNINSLLSHQATISVSADGQTLFIYKDDEGDGNIYYTRLIGETWSTPEKLGSDINSKAWEPHAVMSADGNTLYFVSNRKGGFGGRDIYRCVRLPDGKWSKALNVGPTVNTPYDEDAPFIHPDGRTLYFSSSGHSTMGGFDIFFTESDEAGNWTQPTNIGYPINTVDDDVFFVTSADGKRAYYSSERADGEGEKDIYIIDLPDNKVGPLAVLKGYITPPAGEKVPEGTSILVADAQTGETGVYKPRVRDGAYVIILPPCKEYFINYEIDGTSIHSENVVVPCESSYQEINKEIFLRTIYIGDEESTDTSAIQAVKWEAYEKQFEYKVFQNETPYGKVGTIVSYLTNTGNEVYRESLSKSGQFKYHEMPSNVPYKIQITPAEPIPCDEFMIKLFNENGEVVKQFVHDDQCIFILDESDWVAQETSSPTSEELLEKGEAMEKSGEVGKPSGSSGSAQQGTTNVNISEIDLEKILTEKLKTELKGELKEELRRILREAIKEEFADFNRKYSQPAPTTSTEDYLLQYSKHYTYNQHDIDQEEKEFQEFVDNVAKIIEEKGIAVEVTIEGSASKVPTTSYGTNDRLAAKRSRGAKNRFIEAIEQRNIDPSKVFVVAVNSLVLGPDYRNDYMENKEVYEKYQYVKIVVK